MTTTAIRRLHFWYGICLAILTLVVGILFISQAADIYYSGLDYSRELVIERCTAIAAPFWIWVAAIVAGGVIWMIYPEAEKKLKRLPDERADVERLTQLAADSDDKIFVEAKAAVEREKKIRRVVWLSCLTVCLICAGVALYFIFNLPSYPADPNEAILSLVRTALPCIIVAFAAVAGAAVFDAISAKKVLPYARQMLAVGGRANKETNSEKSELFCKILAIIKIILICLSVVGIVLTIYVTFCVNNSDYNIFNCVLLPILPIFFLLLCTSDVDMADKFVWKNIKVINVLSLASRMLLIVLAIIYIVIGVNNGGMRDVLIKAINICTECIGMG